MRMLHFTGNAERSYEDMADMTRRVGAVYNFGFFADNGFGEMEESDTWQVCEWFASGYEYPQEKQ